MTQITKYEQGSMVARDEFGAQQLATTGETVATVLAAKAKAEVEARFIVAMKRPRDWDVVRSKLLKACERPGFAGSATEKVFGAAWYRKPIGEGIEGFSVRFAEEALRAMGNLDARSSVVWEDELKRLVSVEVLDLETNNSIPVMIVIEKTIERKYLKKGEVAISMRENSNGDITYLRKATEDEVMQKQNSAVSKAIRNGILRLLPGDIQAECRNRILEIRSGDAAKDPEGAKRKIIDAFGGLGVSPNQLKKYLDHEISACSPHEITVLRELYDEIKKGNTTWHEVMSSVSEERGEEQPSDEPEKKKGISGVKDAIKQRPKKEKKPQETNKDFDPREEVLGLARDMWGKKAEDALDKHCRDNLGASFSELLEEDVTKALDQLIAIQEGYQK